jgi:transposase InsO family protein
MRASHRCTGGSLCIYEPRAAHDLGRGSLPPQRRGVDDVEYATLGWVHWFNTARLLAPLGYLPPAEFEAQYHRRQAAARAA